MRNKLILDSAQRHVPSAFKQGKSMSEQLREERMRIEKSAIKRSVARKTDYVKKQYNINNQCNIEAYNFIKQFLNPRRMTWKQVSYLLNQAGYKTKHNKEWSSKKLNELVRLMEE